MVIYFVVFLSFFVDLLCASIAYDYTVQSLLAGYSVMLLNPLIATPALLGFMISLLSLQAYRWWGYCFLELIYLVPITIIGLFLRSRIHNSFLIPVALGLLCLALQQGVIDWGIFGVDLLKEYTIRKNFITIMILAILSLTMYRRGNLGNRF